MKTREELIKEFMAVSKLIPLSLFLGKRRGMVKCPFHMDSTPSAKMFLDDADGIEKLHCFSCRKQFTSYHYIGRVLGENPFEYLALRVSKDRVEAMMASAVGEKEDSTKFEKYREILEREGLIKFLKGVYQVE